MQYPHTHQTPSKAGVILKTLAEKIEGFHSIIKYPVHIPIHVMVYMIGHQITEKVAPAHNQIIIHTAIITTALVHTMTVQIIIKDSPNSVHESQP